MSYQPETSILAQEKCADEGNNPSIYYVEGGNWLC